MQQPFSNKLEQWLKKPGRKTFGDLEAAFGEKSFAVGFLLLMSVSALPLPTGGITTIFELLTIALAIEMIVGLNKIWTPKSWRDRNIGERLEKKALPKFIKIIRWFERYSRKRLASLLNHSFTGRLIGLVVLLFALGSLLAVPFSGLDTLPALGIVIVSLSLILDDVSLFFAGVAVGTIGIYVELTLGKAAWQFLF
jgi:hypothetical protein